MALPVSTFLNHKFFYGGIKKEMKEILSISLLAIAVLMLVANFIDIRQSNKRNG
jgi:hypothetical protein